VAGFKPEAGRTWPSQQRLRPGVARSGAQRPSAATPGCFVTYCWTGALAGVPQLTGDLVHIRSRRCWSAARGIGQQAESPSNTTCDWSPL
jgi:hypothetical protein